MEQGHHPESNFAGDMYAVPVPVPNTVCAQVSPVDDQRVFDQLLDTLVRLMARRVATIIIETGHET